MNWRAHFVRRVTVGDNLPEGVQWFDKGGQIRVGIRPGLRQYRITDFFGQLPVAAMYGQSYPA